MAIAPSISAYMDKLGVTYTVTSHPKSYSSAETAYAAHVPDDHIAKAVLVKNGDEYLLVVVPGDQWVNLDLVSRAMGKTFVLAPEEEIDRLFVDCIPGAIPPIGQAYGIETLLDNSLTSLSKVHFEAGDHEQLITVNSEQFERITQGLRRGNFSEEV